MEKFYIVPEGTKLHDDFPPLEPLQEIKASEFWRVIEDYEEANKDENK